MPSAFNRLLVTWFASVTGDGLRFAALPLLALAVSPSPAAVSAVAAATTLPWLLIALPAGVLVDRLDPARVIAWANAGRAVVQALLVAAVLTDRVGVALLCAVGFALTAGETFADSAGQSLLVRIVPRDRLETGNARFVSSENIGLDLVGPLTAGALFVVAPWLPFAVAGVVFLGTAYGVLALRGHRADEIDSAGYGDHLDGADHADHLDGAGDAVDGAGDDLDRGDWVDHAPADHQERTSDQRRVRNQRHRSSARDTHPPVAHPTAIDPADGVGRAHPPLDIGGQRRSGRPVSVVAAFRVIFADPQLRVLVVTVAIMSASIAAAESVLVVYSAGSLRLPPALYPTLLACYSVGLVAAAAAVSRWAGRLRPGALMVGAVAVIGTTLLLMGLFPHPVVAWLSFLAMGAGGGVWNVLSASRRQRRTPPTMVARVSSTFRAISWGALPLGSALGGLIGEAYGVPTVFVVAGGVLLVLCLVGGRLLMPGDRDDPGTPSAGNRSATDLSGAAEPV